MCCPLVELYDTSVTFAVGSRQLGQKYNLAEGWCWCDCFLASLGEQYKLGLRVPLLQFCLGTWVVSSGPLCHLSSQPASSQPTLKLLISHHVTLHAARLQQIRAQNIPLATVRRHALIAVSLPFSPQLPILLLLPTVQNSLLSPGSIYKLTATAAKCPHQLKSRNLRMYSKKEWEWEGCTSAVSSTFSLIARHHCAPSLPELIVGSMKWVHSLSAGSHCLVCDS
ncbi:hypothetical protein PR048_008304 [Dryococelus australis]|uniref:Uncharacterized protein n=1 Tax=Dryococelus australis TaxID=614101 RepID=A0ABQ9HWR0_9NEOP|nr:hypothetical protein PR048_008304 [Dryococelus australis]